MESGTYELTEPSLATAESAGHAFAAKAGCAGGTASSSGTASASEFADP